MGDLQFGFTFDEKHSVTVTEVVGARIAGVHRIVRDRDGVLLRSNTHRQILPPQSLQLLSTDVPRCPEHGHDTRRCILAGHSPSHDVRFTCAGLAFTVGPDEEAQARALVEYDAAGPSKPGTWRSPWSWFRRVVIGIWLVGAVLAFGWEFAAPPQAPVAAQITAVDDDGWCHFTWQDPTDGSVHADSDACPSPEAAEGDHVTAWSSPGSGETFLRQWSATGSAALDALGLALVMGTVATLMSLPFNSLADAYDQRRLRRATGAIPGGGSVAAPLVWSAGIVLAAAAWIYLLGDSDSYWVFAPLLIGVFGAPYLFCMSGRDGMPPETFANGALELVPRFIAEAWN